MTRLTWIDSVHDHTWLSGLRAANLLLRSGHPVHLAPAALLGAPYLAVPDLTPAAARWLKDQDVSLHEEDPDGGPASDLIALRAPRVAVFGGAGSPYNHASALAALGVAWCYVTGVEIAAGALDDVDLLLVPGGGWRHGNGQLQDLGAEGTAAVSRFVEAGGGYLSSCAGSLIAMRLPEAALAVSHPTKRDFTLIEVENWARLRQAEGGHRSPGIGRVRTRIPEPRHPISLGLPEHLEMTHYNGPIFSEPEGDVRVAVRYEGVTDGFTPSECFFGHEGRPSADDLAASDMATAGSLALPAVVVGERGRGRVVLAGLHPEFGLDEHLDNWSRPVQLIGNAVLWMAQRGCGAGHLPTGSTVDLTETEKTLRRALDQGRSAARALRSVDHRVDAGWLDGAAPRAAFGKTPAELWRGTVDGLGPLFDRVAAAWDEAKHAAQGDQTARLAAAAGQRYEPADGPDLGAQGAIWLIEEATRLITGATRLLGDGGVSQPDAEFRVSRSYLSAVGVLTNAEQRLTAEAATYAAEADLAAVVFARDRAGSFDQ